MTPEAWVFMLLALVCLGLFTWRDYQLISERRAHLLERLKKSQEDCDAWGKAAELARKSSAMFDTFWWNTFIYTWYAIGLQRRIDAAGLTIAEHPEQADEVCSWCLNPIDTSTCHCGSAAKEHYEEHHPVPMGCTCHNIPLDLKEQRSYWKDRCAHAEALASGREWIEPPPLRGEQEDPF